MSKREQSPLPTSPDLPDANDYCVKMILQIESSDEKSGRAHVTLAYHEKCPLDTFSEMTSAARRLAKTALPMHVDFGRHIWVGPDRTLEAVEVIVPDSNKTALLREFFAQFTFREKEQYPFNLHVTMDSEHKRGFVRQVERDDHHVVLDVSLIEVKNMTTGFTIQFAAPVN